MGVTIPSEESLVWVSQSSLLGALSGDFNPLGEVVIAVTKSFCGSIGSRMILMGLFHPSPKFISVFQFKQNFIGNKSKPKIISLQLNSQTSDRHVKGRFTF